MALARRRRGADGSAADRVRALADGDLRFLEPVRGLFSAGSTPTVCKPNYLNVTFRVLFLRSSSFHRSSMFDAIFQNACTAL